MKTNTTTPPQRTGKPSTEILLQATEEWRITLDSIRDAVCLLDADGFIRRCNRAMQEFLALPFPDINGRHCLDLIYGQQQPPGEYDLKQLTRRTTFCIPIGKRWYDITLTPVFDGMNNLTAAVHVMADVTDIREAEHRQQLHNRQKQKLLQAISVRMTHAEEALKKRLAQELHDRVGQTITALGINLNYVQHALAGSHPDLHMHLEEAQSEIENISDAIRNVMAELRPAVLDDYGLAAALRGYGEKLMHRAGITVDVVDIMPERRLPQDVEIALFRIAQEALTNISKHAHATGVTITLTASGKSVQMKIEDNGQGFDTRHVDAFRQHGHWGLLTMRERAEGIGGHCSVSSIPGQGTIVTVDAKRSQHVESGIQKEDNRHPS